MDALIEGYRRFRASGWQEHRRLFKELAAKGQSPRALVITCSDSRLDPQLIFNTAPGEIFVIRNVAALVPPYERDSAYHGTSAALEFAVRVLKVEHIIIMGHAQRGGIGALLRGAGEGAGAHRLRPSRLAPALGIGGQFLEARCFDARPGVGDLNLGLDLAAPGAEADDIAARPVAFVD
jgi:carbonic anhydrase